MQSTKCPICKKFPVEPINLKCSHHPCFLCAQTILAIEQQSQLQTKYRIICPVCRKKTITYDIRHLIISFTQQQQDLYVTNKYIDKKPQIKLKSTSYDNQYFMNNQNSKRNSIQTIATNNEIIIECKQHKSQHIKYFCMDCYNCKQIPTLLCSQCCKNHCNTQNKHKVLALKQSTEKIVGSNIQYKQLINMRKSQLDNCMNSWQYSLKTIFHDYEKVENQINEQFQKVYNYIAKKHQQLKTLLKNKYAESLEQINQTISKGKTIRENYQQAIKIPLRQVEHHINFYSYYQSIQTNLKGLLSRRIPTIPIFIKNTSDFCYYFNQMFNLENIVGEMRKRKNSNYDSLKIIKENMKPSSNSNAIDLHKLIA